MKICNKCKAEKPLTEFHKDKSSKDGFQARCKICQAEIGRKYNAANREKISARNRATYASDPEGFAALKRAYRAEHPERVAQCKRKHYAANKEKFDARELEYRKSNPEMFATRSRNRRGRIKNADGSHTQADVLSIFSDQRGMCANCNSKLFKSGAKKYHVDHIMPLALGGSNWPENLQCLCPPCNLSKGAKHPDAWAKQQGKLL